MENKNKINLDNNKNIETTVHKILSLQLDISRKTEITGASKLADDLGADSLDFVELLLLLEDEFGVEIHDEVAESLHTVDSICEFISSQIVSTEAA